MAENLRTCPFCGGEAKTVKADNPSYTQHSEGWYVMCSCGASLGYHGNDDQYRTYGDFASELGAAMAWNKRAERTCHLICHEVELPDELKEADVEINVYECSECSERMFSDYNYCPNCGARTEVDE